LTRTIQIKIIKQTPPWSNYGFNVQTLITPQWQHYHLWDHASVTAEDGRLQFLVGDSAGELWLDNIQFQARALGVWVRQFDNGLVVINTTKEAQTVSLPGVYCKLEGNQSPLFQDRVDDDEAWISSGWSESVADFNHFGKSIQVAAANTAATVTYTPDLAYSGTYEVLAWVVPTMAHSSGVSVIIHHTQGETVVTLDQTVGEEGWHSLGTYSFEAGTSSSAVLTATGDGIVVADAFKWVSTARYNDGSQVSQITLQPHDGIILLSSSCHPSTTWWNYLPLIVHN
jgi:hypothetical protein